MKTYLIIACQVLFFSLVQHSSIQAQTNSTKDVSPNELPNGTTLTQESESYSQHPDALQQTGVPVGVILSGVFEQSNIFPGTTRDYWVYVPQQYDPEKSAALMVFQDGGNYARRDQGFRIPNVFDNLIAGGEMPITIAVFVNPGIVPAKNENAQPRFNRSFEYDSVDDRYARFLLDELLPMIEKKHQVNFTTDPNLRAICGSSSGGICALNVAWHRPDQFRRVFTTVGTYVGLRGAEEFSTLVRKTEPKPLRVYLQDGSNDLNIYCGDWWMANQSMLRALQWSGYEVEHTWGEGFHNGKQGTAIVPDVMRWLWKDFDTKPVTTHWDQSQNEATQFLVDGEGWELVSDGHQWAEGLAVTGDGELYFTDVPASKMYRVTPEGIVTLVVENTGKTNGISLGPDGRIYGAASGAKEIRAWDLQSFQHEVIAQGTSSNDIVVRHDGTIYYTDPAAGKVWMIEAKTHERRVVDEFPGCNGIGLSADQTQLFVADFNGRFIYSFQISDDGLLLYKQPYYYLEIPTNQPQGHLDGMCMTRDGWLVATTEIGVQICDQPGRSHLIIPLPTGSKRPCYVAFGSVDGKTLYVGNVDKVWKRKTKLTGAPSWQAPVKPPVPRL